MPWFLQEDNKPFHFSAFLYNARALFFLRRRALMPRFASVMLSVSLFLLAAAPVIAGVPEFRLRAGDVLQVTVWKEAGLDQEVVVLPDGTITFPLAGTVAVQKLTVEEAQEAIKQKLSSAIPDASVAVMVKSPMGHTVSVIGQVTKPGDFVIGRQMTVMQALSQAGGLTPFASEGNITVLRNVDGKKTSIEYPYNDIVAGKNFDKDVDLLPGDVVFVPSAGLF